MATQISGRADQAEKDAQIEESYAEKTRAYRDRQTDYPESRNGMQFHGMLVGAEHVAAAIRKEVQ